MFLGVKTLLFIATILLALDARFRIISRYRRSGEINIVDMAIHIALVTAIAVGFAIVGWMIRYL